jgi:hypothetical protein
VICLTLILALVVVSVAYWLGRVDGRNIARDRCDAERLDIEMRMQRLCASLRYEPTEETDE